jgi:hypothetical protein
MDKFLHAFVLPKLNQKDKNHLNRSTTSNETEAAIKGFPINKSPGPDRVTAKF